MSQMALLLLKGNNCANLFWNPCINVQVMPGQAHFMYMTILTFIWLQWPCPSTYVKKRCQKALFLLKVTNCAKLFWNPCINVQAIVRTSSIHVSDNFDLYLTRDLDLQPTKRQNVSKGTSPPQGQQLCQIALKSMHYCTSYGPDKSGRVHRRTHIHRTKIVTTMSR